MFRSIKIVLFVCIFLCFQSFIAAENEQLPQLIPSFSSGDVNKPTNLYAVENDAANAGPAAQDAESVRKARQLFIGYPYGYTSYNPTTYGRVVTYSYNGNPNPNPSVYGVGYIRYNPSPYTFYG